MTRLEIGVAAPSFSLRADDGTTISLNSLKGQRFVLYFYPADDTPGCTKEACQFNELLAKFRASKTLIIGVSPDNAQKHQLFKKKYGLKFPLLSDETKEVMAKYGAYGEKKLYGKTVVGVIRSTFVISTTGRLEHAFYAVRTDGHAARVLGEILG